MKLRNTMTGEVEDLQTIEPDKVRFYSCGLTVYSQPHIGNWLGYIYWDVLQRTLIADDYDVIRTQNITDVGHLTSDDDSGEDKLEKGARQEGTTAWDIAKKYSAIADHEAYDLLGLIRPTHLVTATSLIDKQIAFAKELDEKGYLYEIPGEGMYFDTSKVENYGKLARLDVAGLAGGTRVSVDGKRHITDFAVWKFSPTDAKRDMEWESPWGTGFPGWHLECSVIARETLGDTIDIHSGGIDHIPVHHTNEIAQSESLTGKTFANLWLHNNHIKIDGQKVSKSLGNIVTLDDISEHGYSMDAFKLMVLSKHYATEGNFTWDIVDAANNRLQNWRTVAALRHQLHDTLHDENADNSIPSPAARSALLECLNNNLDTVGALRIIDETFSATEKTSKDKINRRNLADLITSIDELLGLHISESTPDISDEQKQSIVERNAAREAKDWQASDRLRDDLLEQGIALDDTNRGTTWHYTK